MRFSRRWLFLFLQAFVWQALTSMNSAAQDSVFLAPAPVSTLLPANTTQLTFTVHTTGNANCRYSIGQVLPYASMTPFDNGDGSTTHSVEMQGLNPDTNVLNQVYVRADSAPNQLLHLQYRVLPVVAPGFPRKGNLWGGAAVLANGGIEHAKRIDLWLGSFFNAQQIRQLRKLNPNVLVLGSINAIEHKDSEQLNISDSYWLKDIHGQRIEVWPGAYRLNMTRPEVVQYQANFAYHLLLDQGLIMDGMFFDNVLLKQSNLTHDVWGNPVQVDADGDGLPDDPVWLDAAWRAGVLAELQAWRQLMPDAYASGHLPDPPQADFAGLFNGDSIGIVSAGVKDGTRPFQDLWNTYQSWWTQGRMPSITMMESSPPDEMAYGYGYDPANHIPATTLDFAEHFYPYMRFGLGVTLMNDGYFAHEFGDNWHGNDWWYDELDVDLGQPLGAARRVQLAPPASNQVHNGGFEAGLTPWTHWVNSATGAAASFVQDNAMHSAGKASLRVDISNAGAAIDNQIALFQTGLSIKQGTLYDLSFSVRADMPHAFSVVLQKGSPDWQGYGLSRKLMADNSWQRVNMTFSATATATDGRLSFNVGTTAGAIWIDEVRLVRHPADVFQRDFSNGTVILNGSNQRQLVPVSGASYQRLLGSQAPRYQYVVDDADSGFHASVDWLSVSHDSGLWRANGPWFHDWAGGAHQSSVLNTRAQWALAPRADDSYSVDVWWPAAPEAGTWSQHVRYELMVGSTVVASATLDQTTGGDQWHHIATVALTKAGGAVLRLTNLDAKVAIADAVLVQSAARYNDGSPATSVELDAMDAVILQKLPGP